MSYRVCIPTAGTGSRLAGLTRYVNKSLVGIANRPTLSHLIEQFPDDTEFVIALGHKGHLVREFIELAYPERIFFFSEVAPYEGEGSGLGLSILSCKEYLQQPFVFISCDTLVKGDIPDPDHNWMAYDDVEDLSQYRTLKLDGVNVSEIFEKGDKSENLKAYIGLAGIFDYELFWSAMEQGGEDSIVVGESFGMRMLVSAGNVSSYKLDWFDTGNPFALERTRDAYKEENSPNILDKANEAIWFIKEKVVKFSDDESFIANRVKRAKQISDYVPQIVDWRPHMYLYHKVDGEVFSDVVNLKLFESLLGECKLFWEAHDLNDEEMNQFKQTCMLFYKDKTESRIDQFYKNFNKSDGVENINGEDMPLLSDLMAKIDWEWVSSGQPGRFHGDFHFENIVWSEDEHKFVFLDWRQDFGGSIGTGDVYYDLAKLMHGLIISHELIGKALFAVKWSAGAIDYDFNRKQVLVECELMFNEWIITEGYDLKKVRLLTALIYLNIAALHHHPYSLLLYSLGKRMLKQELER